MKTEETKHVIRELGGVAAVARIFSISRQAVDKWAEIPPARKMYLQAVYPHLFDNADQSRQKAVEIQPLTTS